MNVKHNDVTGPNRRRYDRRAFIGLAGTAMAGAGAFAIAGRGGSAHDEDPPVNATPAATPLASPGASPISDVIAVEDLQYDVALVDLAFQPTAFTIPANTNVVVTITNLGALPHDFTADQIGVQSAMLSSGDVTTVTINASPGTYQYYCSVPGHRIAGMRGTLTVA